MDTEVTSIFEFLEGFVWGVLGGILVEALFWWRIRDKADRPDFANSVRYYWLPTIAMIFAGGVIVIAHLRSGSSLSAHASLNLGASAPLVLGAASKSLPEVDPGRVDSDELDIA